MSAPTATRYNRGDLFHPRHRPSASVAGLRDLTRIQGRERKALSKDLHALGLNLGVMAKADDQSLEILSHYLGNLKSGAGTITERAIVAKTTSQLLGSSSCEKSDG